ncbi:MAG TPA: DUF4386 domain-containing protein, partial [Thermoanaerobaculia bacterium]|nr:DUF4386 domain-containing protein [Thermoanaerobaculia bacterium]
MTRTTNARVAGFTFLFYIAAGIASMVLFGRATGGEGIAAKLAGIAQHATDLRVVVVLTLLTSLSAWVLGVTLYAITRDEDPDLALLALVCRVAEGVVGGISVKRSLSLLWLATAAGANAPDTESAHALGAYLLSGEGAATGATFFAVGSTLFSYLLLRGRMIPVPLAWLGRRRLDPGRGGASPAARRVHRGQLVHVDAHAGVRSVARALAADQRRRPAARAAQERARAAVMREA